MFIGKQHLHLKMVVLSFPMFLLPVSSLGGHDCLEWVVYIPGLGITTTLRCGLVSWAPLQPLRVAKKRRVCECMSVSWRWKEEDSWASRPRVTWLRTCHHSCPCQQPGLLRLCTPGVSFLGTKCAQYLNWEWALNAVDNVSSISSCWPCVLAPACLE